MGLHQILDQVIHPLFNALFIPCLAEFRQETALHRLVRCLVRLLAKPLAKRDPDRLVLAQDKHQDAVIARFVADPPFIENAPPELIDLGRVGEVTRVNAEVLEALKKEDFIPVIAPVGVGEDGQALNINADLVAGTIAGALKAEKLILLTDVEGVKTKDGTLLRSLSRDELDGLIEDGTISGGMIPKVNCCKAALQHGVNKTYIVDGRVEHAILLEMFTHEGVGTEIVRWKTRTSQ